MRRLLVCVVLLATFLARAASASPLHPRDVVLISYSILSCEIATPPPPRYGLSVIPPDSIVSTYSFTWPDLTKLAAIAYSDRVGMIISNDQAGGSVLSVLHDDGSISAFGSGAPVSGGIIYGIAPTSTDVFMLAYAAAPSTGLGGAELWRMTPVGALAVRIPLPTVPSSFDIAADQCTVLYTTKTAIARFDACRGLALPDFATTDGWLNNVRIAPDGQVLAIDNVGKQLLRFSADGRLSGTLALPLSAESDEVITAFAFDETAENISIGTSLVCSRSSGRIMSVDRATGRILTTISPEVATRNNHFQALATVLEWRAALPGRTSRRRAAGH